MSNDARKPVVLLRGAQLAARGNTPAATLNQSARESVARTSEALTMNGIPVTAMQYCCGRGCKHCRVYWKK
jgi:hypothetical protein